MFATYFPFSVLIAITTSYEKITDYYQWSEAELQCQTRFGTHLATFTSASDTTAAKSLCGTSIKCWFGLNDNANEGNYVWTSGYNGGYNIPWASGEPAGVSDQNCGCIHPPDASLHDCFCWENNMAICDSPPPTELPTESPTYKNCENYGEIKHINWNELQNAADNTVEVPYSNFNISLDKSSLQLLFDIDLEYVGTSTDGNINNNYNLGTTYIIDFQSFGSSGNIINEPGNCQNRIYSSFQTGTFDEWWNYSEYPYRSTNDLGWNSYLAYPPPSQYWTLSIDPVTCTPISYDGIFSWNDLSHCIDYNGNELINIVDNNISITLSGTLYVNLVSPYSMSSTDTGIYRSFPLIQQDFEISILKQINVISSTGVKLFITSIIGIYEDERNRSFKLSILTQSADYIELINPIIISTPLGAATIIPVTATCLVASSYTCGQIFTLTIDESQISCPPADFSGTYNLQFEVNCPGNQVVCNTFIDDNDGTSIALEVQSNFVDTNCEPELYQVIFTGNIQFYDDDQFGILHDDQNGDNLYVIGQDTIYVQVETNFPDDGSGDNFVIFGVVIDNVFVCTADDTVDLTANLNQQNGINGGCLSSLIDPDGPYNIILNGVENSNYQTQIISNTGISNIVQFSFLTFNIGRTKMYVHVQLTLILQNGVRRRLQLLQSNDNNNSDQIRHFIGSTEVSQEIVSEKITTTTSNNKYDYTDTAQTRKQTIAYLLLLLSCFYFCFFVEIN